MEEKFNKDLYLKELTKANQARPSVIVWNVNHHESKTVAAQHLEKDVAKICSNSSSNKICTTNSCPLDLTNPSGSVSGPSSSVNQSTHKCSVCGKCFNTKYHLMEHERTHTGEKPYECKFCGKSFIQKSILNRHVVTHTGKKPYNCLACGKCFIQKYQLTQHEITHTGKKLFKCEKCDKCYNCKSSLDRHKKSHVAEEEYILGI